MVVVGVVLGTSTSSVLWAPSSGRILLVVAAVGTAKAETPLGVSYGSFGLHEELLLLVVIETAVV